MRCFTLELEAELSPLEEGSLVRAEALMEDWRQEGDEGEEGSAPVRKRSERAVQRPSHRIGSFQFSNRTEFVERTAHTLIMTCSAHLFDLPVQSGR